MTGMESHGVVLAHMTGAEAVIVIAAALAGFATGAFAWFKGRARE